MTCTPSPIQATSPGRPLSVAAVPSPVADLQENCRKCRKCVAACRFLDQNGTPGDIARSYDSSPVTVRRLAYSCSLCNLCQQICPYDLAPSEMFLNLRQEAVSLGENHLWPHRRLLNYERFGSNAIFRHLHLPVDCETIFYPGCALTGARPEETLKLYRLLQTVEPTIGIMLDCCNKPSHDLGRQQFFQKRFSARMHTLAKRNIRRIVTGCPSCLQAFSILPHKFTVTTAYSILADNVTLNPARFSGLTCSVHDPCSIRFASTIHADARSICKALGLKLTEMVHNRENTFCCGEGGGVGFIDRKLSTEWNRKRVIEAEDQLLVTYCAGCTSQLRNHGNVHHLVDLLFADESNDKPVARTVTSLQSWKNRLMVKIRLMAARKKLQ